jgi:hypothetical protein
MNTRQRKSKVDNATARRQYRRRVRNGLEFMIDPLDGISPEMVSECLGDVRFARDCAPDDFWPDMLRRYKDHPLHVAASMGFVDVAKACLSRGCDLDSIDENGATPMHEAAASGKVECLRFLIGAGADIEALDFQGRSALDFSGSPECSEILGEARSVKLERDELRRITPVNSSFQRCSSL